MPLAKETLFPKIILEAEFEVTVAPAPETLNPAKSKVPEMVKDFPVLKTKLASNVIVCPA